MEDQRFLSTLEKGRERRGITVRVVRKWTVYEATGKCEPLHVGMVFADVKGEAMYAQISDNDLINEKEDLFQIGKVYIVKKFVVENAKSTYKPVGNEYMIEITEHTTADIVRNPPQSIPEYVYRISPFPAIKPAARMVYQYTDVIGYLIKYKALHTFVPKNKEKGKMLREIYIKDLRDNVMKITLWGEQAASFSIDDVYDEQAGNLVVCLVVGCIPREEFKDPEKTCLTGSPACSYYFNPNIPEAVRFHTRFKNTPIYIERPSSTEEALAVPAEDIKLPEKKIIDLYKIDPFDDEDQGPYKCAVTLSSIINETNWWYMSCKVHKKKAEQQMDGSYKCSVCQGSDTVPRYLLSFVGKDETGEARFLAYDEEARKIVQKDCESIINPLKPKDGLPQPLQNILQKRFVLSVDLTNDSCKGGKKKQYQIKAVLERPPKGASVSTSSATQTIKPHADTEDADSEQLEDPELTLTNIQQPAGATDPQTVTHSTPVSTVEAQIQTSAKDTTKLPEKQANTRRRLRMNTDSIDETLATHDQEDDDDPNQTKASGTKDSQEAKLKIQKTGGSNQKGELQ